MNLERDIRWGFYGDTCPGSLGQRIEKGGEKDGRSGDGKTPPKGTKG